jgi:hypothetical protein
MAMESVLKRVESLLADDQVQKTETMNLMKTAIEEHFKKMTGAKEV